MFKVEKKKKLIKRLTREVKNLGPHLHLELQKNRNFGAKSFPDNWRICLYMYIKTVFSDFRRAKVFCIYFIFVFYDLESLGFLPSRRKFVGNRETRSSVL